MTGKNDRLSLPFLDRLTTRIAIAAVVFLFALATTIAFLVETGYRRNQFGAYSTSQSVLEEQARTAVIQSTTGQALLLESHLREATQTIRHIANFLEIQIAQGNLPEMNREVYESLFTQLVEQNPDLSALYYTGSQGEVIWASPDESPPPAGQAPGTAAFQPEANTSTITWNIPDAVGTSPRALLVSAPVFNQDSLQGVVTARLPLTHLQEHLQQLQTLPGGFAYLLDEDGQIVTATLDGIPESIQQAQSELAASQPEARTVEVEGKPNLLVSVPLSEPRWRVLVVSPVEEIVNQSKSVANAVWADAEQTIRSTLVLVFVFFLVALFAILIVLDRLFNQRIARLVHGVRAVTAGDLAVTVPDTSTDELGLLGGSFNQMTAEIQRRRSELLSANTSLRQSEELYRNLAHNLETRVEEDTREIKQLYRQASTRSQELEVLYQADEQLYRHLRVDQVLQALVDVAVRRMQADKSSVQVWDEAQQRLVVRAAYGFSPSTVARLNEYRPGDGISGKVFQSGQIITLEDAANAPEPANQISAAEGIRSVISVPIRIGNRIFGVFGINYCQRRSFSFEDIRLFQALAQRAAIAIENASLYEQAEQAATLEERQRLARELHDAITQSLYSLVLLAEAGRRYAVAGNLEQVEHHVGRLGETAQQALKEMRLLVYELRPLALAETGLSGAIRQRLDAVEKRAGIQVNFLEEGSLDLPPTIEEQVYRLVNEALNNALKHARARNVSVRLRRETDLFEAEIRDDGQGFDPQQAGAGGMGLSSMRERAVRIGGSLSVESSFGQGTVVRVQVSLVKY